MAEGEDWRLADEIRGGGWEVDPEWMLALRLVGDRESWW